MQSINRKTEQLPHFVTILHAAILQILFCLKKVRSLKEGEDCLTVAHITTLVGLVVQGTWALRGLRKDN